MARKGLVIAIFCKTYLTQTYYYSKPYSKYLGKVKQTGKYIIYDRLQFSRGFEFKMKLLKQDHEIRSVFIALIPDLCEN